MEKPPSWPWTLEDSLIPGIRPASCLALEVACVPLPHVYELGIAHPATTWPYALGDGTLINETGDQTLDRVRRLHRGVREGSRYTCPTGLGPPLVECRSKSRIGARKVKSLSRIIAGVQCAQSSVQRFPNKSIADSFVIPAHQRGLSPADQRPP